MYVPKKIYCCVKAGKDNTIESEEKYDNAGSENKWEG